MNNEKENESFINNSMPLATAAAGTTAVGLYNLGKDYIDKGRMIELFNRKFDEYDQKARASSIIAPRYPAIDDNNNLKFISYDEFKQWLDKQGFGSNLFSQFVTDHPYLTATSLISITAIGAWLASKGVMWLYKKWREYCNNKPVEDQSKIKELDTSDLQ